MAISNSPTFKMNAIALQEKLRKDNLAIFLAQSTLQDENTPNSFQRVGESGYATKLLDEDFKLASPLPKGYSKYYKISETNLNGYFNSAGVGKINTGSQFYYLYNNILYYILGFPGLNYDKNRVGELIARYSLTDISGNFATTPDGKVDYVAVASFENDFELGNNYIPLTNIEEEFSKFNRYSTKTIRANNICGPGRTTDLGNCCLYYTEDTYDSVAGVTHDKGDFWKCVCTRCYKCVDFATRLKADYDFKSYGGGDTGASCLHCENETFPTDCGPCACTKTQQTDWDDILGRSNLSPTLPSVLNATFDKVGRENLSGAIASIFFVKGRTEKFKVKTAYKNQSTLSLPLIGDGQDAQFKLITEKDSNKNEYVIGVVPINRGQNYTYASVNGDTLSDMVEGLLPSNFEINLVPLSGFFGSLLDVLPSSVVISKTITSNQIIDTLGLGSVNFNRVGIANFYEKDGGDFFSDYSEKQEKNLRLATELKIKTFSGLSTTSNDFNQTKFSKIGSQDSSDIILRSKEVPGSSIQGNILVLTTNSDLYKVGEVITSDTNKWIIVSKTSAEITGNGKELDIRKTKIHHRAETKVVVPEHDSQNRRSYTFRIRIGDKEK